MANTVNLTTVEKIFTYDNNTNFIIEQEGELNRFPIADLEIGGGDVTINLEDSNTSEPNPVNADTLGGYSPEEYIALTTDYTNQQVKKAAPRNLLDNSDFTNPVNQRGATEYSNVNYTIDRWKWSYAVSTRKCIVNTGSITLTNTSATTGYFVQLFEQNAKEIPHTIALKRNGIISCAVINWEGSNDGLAIDDLGMVYGQDSRDAIVISVNSGETIDGLEWIALYEGEYTIETLPPYVPKGYGAELSECRRYFKSYQNALFPGVVHGTAGTMFATVVGFDDMRTIPSITECEVAWIQAGGKVVNSDITAEMSSKNRMNLTITTAMDTRYGGCAYFSKLSVSSDL